jgi:AraC-like DNA-binding protein
MLVTHRPQPPLEAYVETFWYYDGAQWPTHREHVLPNGRFQIVIDLTSGSGAISGMRSRYVAIEPGAIRSVIGVVFRPGGAYSVLEVPANAFYDQLVPLDVPWGHLASTLGECLYEAATVDAKFRIFEAALCRALRGDASERVLLHPSIQYALREFRHGPRIRAVAEVAREAGLSRRRFGQLFDEQIGMTPKLYCRLIRFRHVVREIAEGRPVDWAEVALAGGYCDQSHLSHEFHSFSGMSPTSYVTAERPHLNHVRMP